MAIPIGTYELLREAMESGNTFVSENSREQGQENGMRLCRWVLKHRQRMF